MKPILVLAPGRPGAPEQERPVVDVRRVPPSSLAAYAAVIVVDDGSADAARRLLEALRLRSAGCGPRIGVVQLLDDVEPHAGAALPEHARIRRQAGLRLAGNLEVPSIEYQVA